MHDDDSKHVGTEIKAALGDLRQLATQLAGASREWWDNRRDEMTQHDRNNEQRDEGRRTRASRGYGEGYGTAGMQGGSRGQEWNDDDRNDDNRWSRGRETDDDMRGMYGSGGGRDMGGYSQRHGGRERSGFSEYASGGSREQGRAFNDSDMGQNNRYAGTDTGYYSQRGGEYSQGYGRERNEGRIYGPEDFSQRYDQGNVFSDEGYGDAGDRYAGTGDGGSWRERSGSRDFYGGSGRGSSRYQGGGNYERGQGGGGYGASGGSRQSGYGQGNRDFGQSSDYGQGYGQASSGAREGGYRQGGYGQSGYSENQYGQRGQRTSGGYDSQSEYGYGGGRQTSGYGQENLSGQSHRGRGPRGYSRSDDRITEDLNERLTDDHQLDASEIQVSVSGGVATLSGTVEQRWLKHRAEDIAESCSGVKDVRNDIRVVSSSTRTSDMSSSAGSEQDTSARGGRSASGSTSASSGRSGTTGASSTTPSGSSSASGTTTGPGSSGSSTH